VNTSLYEVTETRDTVLAAAAFAMAVHSPMTVHFGNEATEITSGVKLIRSSPDNPDETIVELATCDLGAATLYVPKDRTAKVAVAIRPRN
jgi:hypothetical protein